MKPGGLKPPTPADLTSRRQESFLKLQSGEMGPSRVRHLAHDGVNVGRPGSRKVVRTNGTDLSRCNSTRGHRPSLVVFSTVLLGRLFPRANPRRRHNPKSRYEPLRPRRPPPSAERPPDYCARCVVWRPDVRPSTFQRRPGTQDKVESWIPVYRDGAASWSFLPRSGLVLSERKESTRWNPNSPRPRKS